jgi:hypothetical protein
MDGRFLEEAKVKRQHHAKLVHEGKYVAEVDGRGHVELVKTDEGRFPYLSLEDAYKLDAVRKALHRCDVESAARLSRVFRLTPVTP